MFLWHKHVDHPIAPSEKAMSVRIGKDLCLSQNRLFDSLGRLGTKSGFSGTRCVEDCHSSVSLIVCPVDQKEKACKPLPVNWLV